MVRIYKNKNMSLFYTVGTTKLFLLKYKRKANEKMEGLCREILLYKISTSLERVKSILSLLVETWFESKTEQIWRNYVIAL